MADSVFRRRFSTQALPRQLQQLGEAVVVRKPNDLVGVTRNAIFVRQIYVPDEKANAIFHFTDSATLGIDTSYPKGTTIEHDGTKWIAFEMRRDDDGGWEVQAIQPEAIA